jgi:hypothetical protein
LRSAVAPRDWINWQFPARYEYIEEGLRRENLEPDPESQRLIDQQKEIDEEKRARKCIMNNKYRDKKNVKAAERKIWEEENETLDWLTEEQVDETEVEDYEDEEQELLEPPNYVMESGYRPNPVLVPNEYEDGEKGQRDLWSKRTGRDRM